MGKSSTNHRIVMTDPVGNVAVDSPVAFISNDPDKLSLHIAKLEAQGYTIHKADATIVDLPSETVNPRRFRPAWRWDGAKIIHDLPACRAQILGEVRAERTEKLAETDGEATRNMERGQPDAALTNYRQALRDLPEAVEAEIDGITTAAGLEAYAVPWPTR